MRLVIRTKVLILKAVYGLLNRFGIKAQSLYSFFFFFFFSNLIINCVVLVMVIMYLD